MSQQQLDRIERKINRLAHLLIVAFALLGVFAIQESNSLVLLRNPWIEVGIAALAAVVLLALRRPFRA